MPTPLLTWIPALPPPVHIPSATIHVWRVRLSHPFLQSHSAEYLSESDLSRAAAYRNVTVRILNPSILAQTLQIDPPHIRS